MFRPDQADWLVVTAVASPHLLYAFIWLLPDVWLMLFSRKHPARAVYGFECCAWILKCEAELQVSLAKYLCLAVTPINMCTACRCASSLLAVVVSAKESCRALYRYGQGRIAPMDSLCGTGWPWTGELAPFEFSLGHCMITATIRALAMQALNLSIYDAIGGVGVYYGTRLGLHVPWHKGFPFNFVAHPQYVGSVMTVWAVVAVLYNQCPAGASLLTLAFYWSGLYTITALQEQYL